MFQFDIHLRKSWDDKMKNGHFRYHLDKVETKIIPGSLKYVAQVRLAVVIAMGIIIGYQLLFV